MGNTDGVGGLSRLEHGAIVTVWGRNLGSTQAGSRVYVNGEEAAHVYYWENADPETGDSGPADLYAYHRMQEIAFSVPANANDGKGEIYVVVDGVQSNSLEFTVRSGNIYFVKTTGSDSVGDGSWDTSWATVSWGGASSKIVAGDTVYACDGVVEQNGIDIRYTKGTSANPISVIAYPGADYLSDGSSWGINNYWLDSSNSAEYWNFAKIRIRTDGNGYESFLGGRIVGCSITDKTYATGMGGAIVILRRHGGVKALGNYIYEYGSDETSYLHHTTYITNRCGSPIPAPELGWNYLRDNEACYGLHAYDEGVCGDMTGTYRVHDNVVVNQKGSGFTLGTQGSTDPGFSMPVEVYNNLFINVGLNYSWNQAVYIGGRNNRSHIKFYNNVFYGYAGGVITNEGALGTFGGTWEWRNNVAFDTKDVSYLSRYNNSVNPTASNNIWYNGGDGNPASAPSWETNPITSNPLFVDPENGDFHLQQTSPAIEGGFDVGSIVLGDLDGNPRPQGSGVDIGAYEYCQANVQILHLVEGWNLVGISHEPIDPSCSSIFGDVAVGSIWGWDGSKYEQVSSVVRLHAYWVPTVAPEDVEYEYVAVSGTTPDLSATWNAFAVPAETSLPLPYPDVVGSVWGWDGAKYVRIETTLRPHTGYWVARDAIQSSSPFPLPEPAGESVTGSAAARPCWFPSPLQP